MPSLLATHHTKIRDISVGLVLYESFNTVYDLIFYPVVLATLGLVHGALLATGISLVVNIVIFWMYDHMRVDWLGAHALRQLEHEENKSNIEHLITWLGKKKMAWYEKLASPVVFVGLTLPIDPVIVAIHYRRQHFKGVTARDWGLLLAATIAANIWWAAKLGIVISAIELIWHILFA